jgi:preprotein translocase subunit YajC
MFIIDAFANAASGSSMKDMFSGTAPLLLIIVIFYFLVIRPQQKKIKMHQEMVNNLKKGDKVVTSGGILATVSKVESDEGILVVEIASNVKVKVKRDTISQVLDNTKDSKK